MLVGLAWNFAFIGCSVQLSRSLSERRRVGAQGVTDAGMGLAGLLGALLSGLLASGGGLSAVGGMLVFVGLAYAGVSALSALPRHPARMAGRPEPLQPATPAPASVPIGPIQDDRGGSRVDLRRHRRGGTTRVMGE